MKHIQSYSLALVASLLSLLWPSGACAQEEIRADSLSEDSCRTVIENRFRTKETPDSTWVSSEDTFQTDTLSVSWSDIPDGLKSELDRHFVPDPKKALWLAIVIPGGGQIYNRKYWKLPIIYGGFLGCVYAMTWNNTMYRDYSQAYIDIMDSDETTRSYENFVPPNFDVAANADRLKELFKRKKNYYRRYRDLSMFCMIGVYALSIIDAYVDAELSSFDISPDLTLRVKPTVIHEDKTTLHAMAGRSQSYGLQCSLAF